MGGGVSGGAMTTTESCLRTFALIALSYMADVPDREGKISVVFLMSHSSSSLVAAASSSNIST